MGWSLYQKKVGVIVRVVLLELVFFFFSSRRRHTRLQGDWSSDVCSSDLSPGPRLMIPTIVFHGDRDSTVNPLNGEQVLAQAATGRELERLVERGQIPGGQDRESGV